MHFVPEFRRFMATFKRAIGNERRAQSVLRPYEYLCNINHNNKEDPFLDGNGLCLAQRAEQRIWQK